MAKAKPIDIMTRVVVRKTLNTLALTLCGGDVRHPNNIITTLIEELEKLKQADPSSELWRQATADMTDEKSYWLECVNLLPPMKEPD